MIYIGSIKLKYDKQFFSIDIVRFSNNDYGYVKNFITTQYELIQNKDFFIIDDIDSTLPQIFNCDGMVFGALYNDELISIQAIDICKQTGNSLAPYINKEIKDINFAEMGWTMTKKEYQNKGIASSLIKYVENFVHVNNILVSTVHPQNIAALSTFLHNGYVGINLDNYYGVPRVFLVKRTYNLDFNQKVEFSNPHQLMIAFNKGFILVDIKKIKNQEIYICYAQK